MFNIYLTNLGKYNEGKLIGEWISIPISEDGLQTVFDEIGIDDEYEEYFITDYENDYGVEVGEYDSLDALNELAERLESLEDYQVDVLKAYLESVNDDIYYALDHVDDMYLYTDCDDFADLAQALADEGCFDIPKHLYNYIDWDALGRDLSYEGDYHETSYGILLTNGY